MVSPANPTTPSPAIPREKVAEVIEVVQKSLATLPRDELVMVVAFDLSERLSKGGVALDRLSPVQRDAVLEASKLLAQVLTKPEELKQYLTNPKEFFISGAGAKMVQVLRQAGIEPIHLNLADVLDEELDELLGVAWINQRRGVPRPVRFTPRFVLDEKATRRRSSESPLSSTHGGSLTLVGGVSDKASQRIITELLKGVSEGRSTESPLQERREGMIRKLFYPSERFKIPLMLQEEIAHVGEMKETDFWRVYYEAARVAIDLRRAAEAEDTERRNQQNLDAAKEYRRR